MTGPGMVWIRADSFTGDDLDTVYLGNGHNADVFPIGGGGNGADETGQHGGEIISEQTAVESRFL